MQNLKLAIGLARAGTDHLFSLVRPDALYERPIPERHRLIFYLGHLEAFDWNLIARGALDMAPFHATFDRLFAFGIDPAEGRAAEDRPSDWPCLEEVETYVRRVRELLDERLDGTSSQLLHVALEHRLMHAETFAYLLHNLGRDRFEKSEALPHATAGPLASSPMVEIPAGTATLGRAKEEGFGWDNEFTAHAVDVPAFSIGKHKVTNGEYLRFVRQGASPPHFWTQKDGEWFYRGMFDDVPLPLDWPVYVTHEEAESYARWRGKALPTEAQYHRAAFGTPSGEERPYAWGAGSPDSSRGNFDSHRWDPIPVNATPRGDSAFGVSQITGNGWEWTSTPFEPFPAFERFPFYPGYSADFFDGSHYVLKGGSPRTAAPLLRRSFRNWFRPRYPYLYAGFRLVEN